MCVCVCVCARDCFHHLARQHTDICTCTYDSKVPPAESTTNAIFEAIDLVFTALFTTELAITLLAHWFFSFFLDGWHWFDSCVVTISLASIANTNLPAINSIRAGVLVSPWPVFAPYIHAYMHVCTRKHMHAYTHVHA